MKRRESPLDIVLLIALCAIGIFLGRLQNTSRTAGRVDGLSATINTLVSPVAGPAGTFTRSTGDFFTGIFAARGLVEENRRLKALALSAEMYDAQLGRLEDEVERLRTLQGFGPIPGKERVLADVIGYSGYENRITLNVGQAQGVKPGMPVEAPEGLVGTIQTVEANRCQVLLITSAGLKVGAADLSRDPPPAGFCQGESSNSLTVDFQDPKAPVEIGDRIVTSGFSDKIPPGIIIGRVIAVDADEQFGRLRAKVFPAISVGTLREVHVLK